MTKIKSIKDCNYNMWCATCMYKKEVEEENHEFNLYCLLDAGEGIELKRNYETKTVMEKI